MGRDILDGVVDMLGVELRSVMGERPVELTLREVNGCEPPRSEVSVLPVDALSLVRLLITRPRPETRSRYSTTVLMNSLPGSTDKVQMPSLSPDRALTLTWLQPRRRGVSAWDLERMHSSTGEQGNARGSALS